MVCRYGGQVVFTHKFGVTSIDNFRQKGVLRTDDGQ